MRATQFLISTLREAPSDAEVASHQLMLRAGLVRKLGAGLYHLLPMGLRVFRRIENVVREEMNRAGALEFQLPILTPAELWQTSGRWESMGPEMFRLSDRHKNDNVLGPTHEESFTDLVKGLIRSYRDLPINVYQIHTKFRDEIRPRFGVIRSREFCMKDAYSFDRNEAELDQTYQKMRQAYRAIFARLGLETIPVEADSGSMGGSASEEFMVPSSIGEETLLLSEGGRYRGNQEKTPVLLAGEKVKPGKPNIQNVSTPGARTIEAVEHALKISAKEILKLVVYEADGRLVAVGIRADRQVNEVKLRNHLKCASLLPAENKTLEAAGLAAGFMGPADLYSGAPASPKPPAKAASAKLEFLWDHSVLYGKDWVAGANQIDTHMTGFNFLEEPATLDLSLAVEGDLSPAGDGTLREIKGIEVGHIFKLGHKYSKAFGVTFLDENGKAQTPIMGCYGIGINRTLATIIEQCHDEKGITWPVSAAPFAVALVSVTKGAEEETSAKGFYEALIAAGVDVIWDDRDVRPGVKFADAELIGYPIRLTMGKTYFQEGKLEVTLRAGEQKSTLAGSLEALVAGVRELLSGLENDLHSRMSSHE